MVTLVIASPDVIHVQKMVATARSLNPKIEVIVRTHNSEESVLLYKKGIGLAFFGEEELVRGMARHVLERFAPLAAPQDGHGQTNPCR